MSQHSTSSTSFQWSIIRDRFENETIVSTDFLNQLEDIFLTPEAFTPEQFAQFELAEIFAYLKVSHIHYLEVWLPKIENTLLQLQTKCEDKLLSIQVLLLFLRKYKEELVAHIRHEEQVLFLFVEDLLKGNYSSQNKDFVIAHFLHTHNDNVVLHLEELKKDLVTFDQELKENMIFHVLFHQLEFFQHDLAIHGLIEDNVFIDKVLTYVHNNYEKLPGKSNQIIG